MSDLDNIYPLGGLFGTTPSHTETPDYLKCGVRYSTEEVLDGSLIVRHEGVFYKINFEDFALNYITDKLPIGSIIDFVGDTPPLGWAVLNGSSFEPTSYPELFTLLGTNVLPDFSGRTTAYQGLHNTEAVGDKKGTSTKKLEPDNLPSHTHEYVDAHRNEAGENDDGGGNHGTSPSLYFASEETDFTGGVKLLENVQPTILYNKIIKAVPSGNTDLEFIPPSTDNIAVDTGIEILPFCYRRSGESDETDPYIPTYDLGLCDTFINMDLSTVSGGVSSSVLTKVGDKYKGLVAIDTVSVGGPYNIYLEITEVTNDKWQLWFNFDNTSIEPMTTSLDFPACPYDSTWDSPFTFESVIYTIDSMTSVS